MKTRRFGRRPYLCTSQIRRHLSTCWFRVVRPPLPVRAVDTVVTWQSTIFVHSFGGGATTCHMFGLGLFGLELSRLGLSRLGLSRLRLSRLRLSRLRLSRLRLSHLGLSHLGLLDLGLLDLGRFGRQLFFRRRRFSFRFRSCAVALPNYTEDHRGNHQQDYKIAQIDADTRPRRLRRSVAGEIWTSVAR